MDQETQLDPLFNCALSMFIAQSRGTHTNPQVSGDHQVRHGRCVFHALVDVPESTCLRCEHLDATFPPVCDSFEFVRECLWWGRGCALESAFVPGVVCDLPARASVRDICTHLGACLCVFV